MKREKKLLKAKYKRIDRWLKETVLDRKKTLFLAQNLSVIFLCLVSLGLAILNIVDQAFFLMIISLAFFTLNILNLILIIIRKRRQLALTLLEIEIIVLLLYFVISGRPAGFSVVWTLLLPTAGMFVFGRKQACILSIIMLVALVFFFWTKVGNSLLMYEYSDVLVERLPLVFAAFFAISFLLESEREHSNCEIDKLKAELEKDNVLLEKAFGRFLPKKVVNKLMSTSEGYELSAEKKNVTVMMSDIRGFTALSSKMDPMEVVTMLNHYLDVMMKIIQKYHGTVMDIMGDGLFAIFGALDNKGDHAENALRASIEMENAMEEIIDWNKNHDYPEFEMGIGLYTGTTILGTMGSEDHLEYDAIGNAVNNANRVESYTTGGEIFISDETLSEIKEKVTVIKSFEISPKGTDKNLLVHSVSAIGNLVNNASYTFDEPIKLEKPVEIVYSLVCGKHCDSKKNNGQVIAQSEDGFLLKSDVILNLYDNIVIEYEDTKLNGKVIDEDNGQYKIRYTYKPNEFKEWK